MQLFRRVALCLPLLAPAAAHAEDLGPAQAEAFQKQLKDSLASLLGPSIKLPDLPWKVTGEHDHYLITWPISGATGPDGGPLVSTTRLRPLDGGRWGIDQVSVPPSGSFTLDLPDKADVAGGPMDVTFSIGKQDTHGVFDPAFATPSNLHTEVGDLVVTTKNASQRQEQRFDRYLVDTSLKPTQNGRLDLTIDAAVDGWKSASQTSGGTPVAIGIQALRATGRIDGVNRERVSALVTAAGSLVGALPPDFTGKGASSKLPEPAKAQVRLMVAALQDMLTGVSLEETLDGLQVEIAGIGGLSIKRFKLGFGGESLDGRLKAWLDLGLDELASPSLPPKMAAYLPHRIALRPTLSGIQMADLHKLVLDATDDDAGNDRLGPDIDAIFAHGGVDIGVETLSLDLGPARIDGTGHVKVLSPGAWRGEARLTATGLDDLTTEARTHPELQQALPVLIMLRGLARPEGQRLVWDVVSDGPKITVNGLDLSQLGGGGPGPKGRPPARPPAPPPAKPPGQPPSR
ncbi:MAG: hypothetical protein WDN25_17165 [Acetobacteraceae bacterium]